MSTANTIRDLCEVSAGPCRLEWSFNPGWHSQIIYIPGMPLAARDTGYTVPNGADRTMDQIAAHLLQVGIDALEDGWPRKVGPVSGELVLSDRTGNEVTRAWVDKVLPHPPCREPEHDWEMIPETLGGHHGGVKYVECCCNCALDRVVNTWDQSWIRDGQAYYTYEYFEGYRLTVTGEAMEDGAWTLEARCQPFKDEPRGSYKFRLIDGDLMAQSHETRDWYSVDAHQPTFTRVEVTALMREFPSPAKDIVGLTTGLGGGPTELSR